MASADISGFSRVPGSPLPISRDKYDSPTKKTKNEQLESSPSPQRQAFQATSGSPTRERRHIHFPSMTDPSENLAAAAGGAVNLDDACRTPPKPELSARVSRDLPQVARRRLLDSSKANPFLALLTDPTATATGAVSPPLPTDAVHDLPTTRVIPDASLFSPTHIQFQSRAADPVCPPTPYRTHRPSLSPQEALSARVMPDTSLFSPTHEQFQSRAAGPVCPPTPCGKHRPSLSPQEAPSARFSTPIAGPARSKAASSVYVTARESIRGKLIENKATLLGEGSFKEVYVLSEMKDQVIKVYKQCYLERELSEVPNWTKYSMSQYHYFRNILGIPCVEILNDPEKEGLIIQRRAPAIVKIESASDDILNQVANHFAAVIEEHNLETKDGAMFINPLDIDGSPGNWGIRPDGKIALLDTREKPEGFWVAIRTSITDWGRLSLPLLNKIKELLIAKGIDTKELDY